MPGTITFRPIEANLTHNTDLIGKMNPYCAFIVGDSIFKGQICKKGGKHPHWEDAITVPVTNSNQVIVELFDKDRFSRDDNIGSFLLNLNELNNSGTSSRWYPLTYKNKPAGELLLETTFSGQNFGQGSYGYGQGLEQSTLNQGFIEQTISQPVIEKEIVTIEQPVIVEKEIVREEIPVPVVDRKIFQEQQQVIEERRFLKEVDVVQTQAHMTTIETLEPTKVLRDVQYTQITPVTKQIEVLEPHVVKKEVEVIEPRLVTKTIQVVENVPVKKMVEVIENVPRVENVTTYEPQTFTKQVEITDYVPVQKQVMTTEPVHVKQAVEFVEPVIITKTITKEVPQAVIVDEKITTEVGPASIIGEFFLEFSKLKIHSDERMLRFNEWNRLRGLGYTDVQLDEHFTTQGWGPIHQYRFNELSGHHGHHGSTFGHSNFTHSDRMSRFNEWNRLRGQGYNDHQLDQHFVTQGWGPITQYRFHELSGQHGLHGSNFGHSNFTHSDRMTRFGEWNRLRGQGYNDHQLDQHFTTQGWGPVSSYRFHELGGQHGLQGSQFGNSTFGTTKFSSNDRMTRFKEWLRLKTQSGYNDQQLNQHFTTQGWGPVSQYNFHELEQQGLHGSHYSSNPIGQKY